jgi:hypothetical protein
MALLTSTNMALEVFRALEAPRAIDTKIPPCCSRRAAGLDLMTGVGGLIGV